MSSKSWATQHLPPLKLCHSSIFTQHSLSNATFFHRICHIANATSIVFHRRKKTLNHPHTHQIPRLFWQTLLWHHQFPAHPSQPPNSMHLILLFWMPVSASSVKSSYYGSSTTLHSREMTQTFSPQVQFPKPNVFYTCTFIRYTDIPHHYQERWLH